MSIDWLNRVCKWRVHFAGWQLGTRLKGDPESDAVRDHREVTILLRCENNAILRLLVEKGVFTVEEFTEAALDEARLLDEVFQRRWPGIQSTSQGLRYDARAAEWLEGLRP